MAYPNLTYISYIKQVKLLVCEDNTSAGAELACMAHKSMSQEDEMLGDRAVNFEAGSQRFF